MAETNLHWTAANQTRSYPLADNATALDQNSRRLPVNIITDLSVRYPSVLGNYSFVASVTVTPTLVSVMLQAATALTDGGFSPIGAFTVTKPLITGIPYPIQSQGIGIGGWIVFGTGINTAYAGRFTTTAGLLCPRACRAYRIPPVESIAVLNNAAELTGIVRLRAKSPLEIVGAVMEVNGITRTVALVQLVQPPAPSNAAAATVNVFEYLAGPCNARPESGNCGDPAPIEFINSVGPDCNGNLNIRLRGAAVIAAVDKSLGINNGIVVDTPLGLADVCTGKNLADTNGNLPNTFEDLCNTYSDSLPGSGVTGGGSPTPMPTSDSITVLTVLPHVETFDRDGLQHWTAVSGGMVLASLDSPDEPSVVSETSEGHPIPIVSELLLPRQSLSTSGFAATLNIALWNEINVGTLNRRYECSVRLGSSTPGAKHNAGLVINYRDSINIVGGVDYFAAIIDYDSLELKLNAHRGVEPYTIATAGIPGIQLFAWYRMTVTTTAVAGNRVAVAVKFSGGDISASIYVTVSSFLPDNGRVGFYADRSEMNAGYLLIQEVTP